ncbi:hypothetical protein [Streptomyces flavofungini]|uniref:Secreted protein n=1 Tax=Streptomyces flavofungini TaxID=68200 RepID=A0ABS0XCF0_9ACTN|nr:hypothetical protein [Streptomyces flavofungini]MBJ3810676.1 hypothetical protein [Streptomyces flavofungini]GHC52133.1 hypothetical protein GCM10010349_17550 [Streptomyces flavofungini]
MSLLIIALLLFLIVLGFKAPVLWLFAAALVYLLVRGRDHGSSKADTDSRDFGSDERGPGRAPKTYREYSDRRRRRERWDRRYRRKHPSSTSGGR